MLPDQVKAGDPAVEDFTDGLTSSGSYSFPKGGEAKPGVPAPSTREAQPKPKGVDAPYLKGLK